MVPQSLLSRVASASIGSITFSDHAPEEVDLLQPTMKQWMWRLNDTLIQTPEVVTEVSRELRQYFSTNVSSEVYPTVVWEAHKSYIRGLLIKIGSRVKKERAREIVDLLGKIKTLEFTHKQSLASQTLLELTALRNQLRSLALIKAKETISKCHRSFYEHSNKCGKLLARALRIQKARTFIPEMLNTTHKKIHTTEGIDALFRDYYKDLYNLPSPQSETDRATEKKAIQDYLQK